jgi:hypothetical protein
MCSVVSFATIILYLQEMNIKATQVCKTVKYAFGKHISTFGVLKESPGY